jgi:D-psicose/D-tagatose/L-ribulose 3-epimerase
MKIGMNTLLWTSHVTVAHFPILHELREAGYDGVEIPLFEGDEKHFRTIGRELERIGLKCSTISVVSPDANPISPDKSVRDKAVERLKWLFDMTAAVGGDVLCGPYHSPLGIFSGSGPTEDEKSRAVEVLRAGGEHAAKLNVRIAIEFLCRFESYFLTTAVDARELVHRVNHPNVAMMYDTFHSNIEEKDPPASLAACANEIIHVHISENDRGTPGRGHVQWRETFAALRKINYNGWLTIEAFSRVLPELAAATRVWRDFSSTHDQVWREGIEFIQRMWREGQAS